MKGNRIKQRSIAKLSILGVIGTILSCALISPSLAKSISVSRRIILGDQVDPDPLVLEGISGGKIKAPIVVNTEETSTGFCNGFIDRQPNHILVLSSFFEFLKIEVESLTDTTIIVEGPGGVWCNDDSNNANPAIEGQWQPGKYKIWIGSYQETIKHDYQIKITGQD